MTQMYRAFEGHAMMVVNGSSIFILWRSTQLIDLLAKGAIQSLKALNITRY